jgi:hypothetical protein
MDRLGIESVDGVPITDAHAHADPDLDRLRSSRIHGWRPIFGQADAAQAHLRNQGVSADDVFLFFGRFRHTEEISSGGLRYTGKPFHLIWGYLEVGEIIDVASATAFEPWMLDHVHIKFRQEVRWRDNTIYVAKDQSALRGSLPGGGIFARYRPELRLTRPGASLSSWQLPYAFHPTQTTYPLTYNPPARWSSEGPYAILSAAARGQEFVVEVNHGIARWLANLLAGRAKSTTS